MTEVSLKISEIMSLVRHYDYNFYDEIININYVKSDMYFGNYEYNGLYTIKTKTNYPSIFLNKVLITGMKNDVIIDVNLSFPDKDYYSGLINKEDLNYFLLCNKETSYHKCYDLDEKLYKPLKELGYIK